MTSLTLAVDAMGGDHAPDEVIKGVVAVALEDPSTHLILVGDENVLSAHLSALDGVPANVTLRHAPSAIAMDEHPAQATRKKRDSSLVIAGQMVRSGEAQATFSAGNTGAAMAIASLDIGRIPGIDRPAIAATLPTLHGAGRALLLDAGANVDCAPQNLLQFALLGAIYAEKVWNTPRPSVGLLNIGGEEGKGNELTKAAYGLLQASPLHFLGNVEGREIFQGAADVIVCDGFAGNVLLKAGEGVVELMVSLLQREIEADPHIQESPDVFQPIFQRLGQRVDYAEYGGAPLLGVNGVSVIGHGRSHARAIASGLRSAREAAASGFVGAIREALASGNYE